MVGERSVHVLYFAGFDVLTFWKRIGLAVLISWKGIDVQAIVLDLDALAVRTASW